MTNGTELMHISKLPSAIIDTVSDHITQYIVAVNRVVRVNNTEDLELIGTGTLVTIAGLDCILTAEHVLAAIGNSTQLALLSSFTGGLRRHMFEMSHLGIHRIARGTDDSKGPDVGLIVLPKAMLGSLHAEKVFYNIDKRISRFRNQYLEKERGFWFTCGIVGETEQRLGPSRGFIQVKGYYGICGASANPIEYDDSGFDYLEVQIDYRGSNPDLPASFGGCSGGGIWQVPLRKDSEGNLEPEECLLSGVVFYQTAVEDGIRHLKCHGRKTVYEQVPGYLAREGRS